MISMLTSSAVDHGFEPRLGQAKDNKVGICCFSAKHITLRSKSKDWLAIHKSTVYKNGRYHVVCYIVSQ
jgi:hypothetical protein